MMNIMKLLKTISVAIAAVLFVACGADDAPVAADTSTVDKTMPQAANKPQQPADRVSHSVKPTVPYRISYDVVGTPVVGSPVTIQLQIRSVGEASLTQLDFRTRDTSALMLGQSQPSSVNLEFADNESSIRQQVTVIPQREGRHYLNVSVSAVTPFGQDSTTMAIPVQVGEGGRELIGSDRIITTESGERVLVNPGN